MSAERVGYRIVGTLRQTVKADHTSAHVDSMVIEVDTLRFADVDTATALSATICIYVKMECGTTRQKAQDRADRTQGIAEQPPAAE